MSDQQERFFKGTLASWATPILIGLVGFFGGGQLNDVKKELRDIRSEMKELREGNERRAIKQAETDVNVKNLERAVLGQSHGK